MFVRLSPVLGLIALAGTVAAADGSEDTVTIRDFTIVPMGNLSFHQDRVVVHPKAMVGAGYNSNVYAAPDNETADTYGEVVAGVETRYLIGDSQKLMLDLEGEGRGYHDETSRNLIGGRARGRYDIEDSQGMKYQVLGAYARYDDPLIETGQQIDRGASNLGGVAEWQGARNRLALRGEWQNENFFEAGTGFGEDERDSDTVRGTLTYGYGYAEDAEVFARLVVDALTYAEHGARFQDSTGTAGLLGWRGVIATRISAIVEGGIQHRSYDDDFNRDPAFDDETVLRPIGSASMRWNWEQGSHIGVRASSTVDKSISSNAAYVTSGEVDVRYRLLEKAALIGSGQVSLLEQSGAAAGREIEKRGTIQVRAGGEYFLRDGLGLRLVGTYEDSMSKTANDYDRLGALLSLGFAY